MNKKSLYEEIEIEIILFDTQDIITTSGDDEEKSGEEEENVDE